MKAQITTVLLFSAALMWAQNEPKKQATVRIKKVENMNGIETITDTTYTTDDPESLVWFDKDGAIKPNGEKCKAGEKIHLEISEDMDGELKKIVVKTGDLKLDEELQKTLDNAPFNKDDGDFKQVIIMDNDVSNDGTSNNRKTKIIIVKSNITDAQPEDLKRLKNELGSSDNKLELQKINLFPNPSNGKFNLSFTLNKKGNTEVLVYGMDGKEIYKEKLLNFVGDYHKTIDLSENAKGIYFIKVIQGDHSQIKKVILE